MVYWKQIECFHQYLINELLCQYIYPGDSYVCSLDSLVYRWDIILLCCIVIKETINTSFFLLFCCQYLEKVLTSLANYYVWVNIASILPVVNYLIIGWQCLQTTVNLHKSILIHKQLSWLLFSYNQMKTFPDHHHQMIDIISGQEWFF